MSESTLIIEKHKWRGFNKAGGELGMARTFGWFTVTYCPFLLTAFYQAKIDLMRSILRGDKSGANAEQNTKQRAVFPKHRVVQKESQP